MAFWRFLTRPDQAHADGDRQRKLQDAHDDEQEQEQDGADGRADGLDTEPVGHPHVTRVPGERQAFPGPVAER